MALGALGASRAFAASAPTAPLAAPTLVAASSSATTLAPVEHRQLSAFGGRGFGRMVPGALRRRLQLQASLAPGQFSVGSRHACAISVGRLYCWGESTVHGRLGTGSSANSASPVQVLGGFVDWVEVSAGESHTCARRATGALYCWGDNSVGQLGLAFMGGSASSPTQLGGATDWVEVSAGSTHTCGRRPNGYVYCWGQNNYGQVGDSTIDNRDIPTAVRHGGSAAFGGWTKVSAGTLHTCGIRYGRIYCWGTNQGTRLGSLGGPSSPEATTTPDPNPSYAAVSLSASSAHSCMATADGNAYCWGANNSGEAGNGTTGELSLSSPSCLVSMSGFTQVDTGNAFTCGRHSTGQLYCWGYNGTRQLGDGTNTNRNTPALVSGGFADWVEVSAGDGFTCGRRSTGQLYCWGSNQTTGFLGIGNTETGTFSSPQLVSLPS